MTCCSSTDPIKTTFFFFLIEIIDYLYEKKLPELEEKLRKKKGKHCSFDNSAASQQQKAFRLSDIFDSSEESD